MTTTPKQLTANRRNALKSTGPRTPEGKAKTSMNALKHGLRSVSLAVPVLENPEDWEAHRGLVVHDLNPVGYLETVLAERAAAILWRLGRVVRYESASVSNAIHKVEEKWGTSQMEPDDEKKRLDRLLHVQGLKSKDHVDGRDVDFILDLVASALDLDLEDEKVSSQVEVPEDFTGEYWSDFKGWTREGLEGAVESLRKLATNPGTDPWKEAQDEAESRLQLARATQEANEKDLDRDRKEALIPSEETLEKVSRYEAALERSLFRTIHELRRLQAARDGVALPPPAAVDVDLST